MDAMLRTFFNDWSAFAIVGKLLWVAQLALIVHVFKTGRPFWWFWILFSAPVIGGAAYFLIEVAPELRRAGAGGMTGWRPRAWRIRQLRSELEETDTVKLRLALAEELLESGDVEGALEAAEKCRTGVFRDDPHTLAAVAHYQIEAGRPNDALQLIAQINTRADRMLAQDVALLRGRALFLAGKHDDAQAALRAVSSSYVGEEPRYFLALSLKETGGLAEARELWTDIRKRFRRASRGWRRSEKRWFKFAGERLKETKGA
jgi:hypothetical protein